ncbi:hypothetical protein [Streptomyces acidiscabies]|uniref:Uncharacterized protein n=1 Tax=Streptomyces acidiscabies TaxID=42234 RepID=A0AAP6BLJ2_9ACTN|nr:hypothetical protein [Streptomyces acidiscabies]MBP5942213.1 hypothetical protein [Streptomyces sp. LBUM 1476]MBZ3913732.1 hypothetical protein [Streptomyces acidiscabies]MDX2966931.1 hypothetical protein [Streptomyces acidiscabies]MDX3022177.1 hypothetical protein [Streptomyces acidiscabies]MDX3795440.1 hypothetical protein [Streptomyces acidiscabies]
MRALPSAPLVELKLALMMLRRPDVFGRWRRGLRQRLPGTTRPLWDLISAYTGPAFLDPLSTDLATGLDAVRAAPITLVRAGVEQAWAGRRGPVPLWLRDLVHGDVPSRERLCLGLHDAFDAASWPQVAVGHEVEFARYALDAAKRGVAGALAALCPGSRLVDGCWDVDAPYARYVTAADRGLVPLPTFYWTGAALAGDNAAGGLSSRSGQTGPALRGAGLIDTVRNGRAVRHGLTALGKLLTRGAGQGDTFARKGAR